MNGSRFSLGTTYRPREYALLHQIEATDSQIEALVRELRGLSEEEIAIVDMADA
jgi:hypothetical protein